MLESAGKYEMLFDLPKGEYNAPEVGGIRTKTFRMADVIEMECYPLTRIGSAAKAEYQRRRKQRACQAALNRRNAEKRVRRLLDANFTEDDYLCTFTWDYGQVDRFHMGYAEALNRWERFGLPLDEDDARRHLNNYWRRMRTKLRQIGQDPLALKYLYVLEPTHMPRPGQDEALPPHFHFHVVIHAPGMGPEEIKALWPFGDVHCDRVSFRDGKIAGLASYLTKSHSVEAVSADGKRVRRWGCSRNLVEPVVTVSDRRISRRRAMLVAADVERNAKAVFEAVYPGYYLESDPIVRYSDYVPGAYIYARLRKRKEARTPWERARMRN